MDWYALFVETGKEEQVQQCLRRFFNESTLYALVPKRLVPEKKSGNIRYIRKIMFPGYVIIRTLMDPEVYLKLKNIPKVYYLLKTARLHDHSEFCTKIQPDEISLLAKLMGGDEILGISEIYLEGSSISVTTGPLQGMEGLIKKIDRRKKRAKIIIPFLGRDIQFEVGIEILRSVQNRCQAGITSSYPCPAVSAND
ncbi:MAG TPA: antiterminator LoaP [Brevibacillus sp.]|nr:antiterminator LoaP [Brevibacillus sp.]